MEELWGVSSLPFLVVLDGTTGVVLCKGAEARGLVEQAAARRNGAGDDGGGPMQAWSAAAAATAAAAAAAAVAVAVPASTLMPAVNNASDGSGVGHSASASAKGVVRDRRDPDPVHTAALRAMWVMVAGLAAAAYSSAGAASVTK